MAQKAEINKDEKTAIARYAASLIERDDFVYLDAGTTEAVVGNQAILSLQKLHFSKAFLGTNGVGLKAGFSTPDYSEALVKQTAVEQARQVFVLADYSKFGNVSSVTFASLERGVIFTDRRPPESFGAVRNIKVVGE